MRPTPDRATGLLPARTVLHAHLVHVLEAEAERFAGDELSILDCGCGEGHFLELATKHLGERVGRPVSPWGFDVHDDQIQFEGFMGRTVARLRAECPDVAWDERLTLISRDERTWPFKDEMFDAVVSNQVCEHVEDLEHFLGEVSRVLRPGGIAVHVFPLRDYVVEGHTGVPFAHRLLSHDALVSYLRSFGGGAGIARFAPARRDESLTLDEYAEARADLIAFHTWYRRLSDVAHAAKKARLRMSYRYTPELYALKLGYLLRRDVTRIYRRKRNPLIERILFSVAKRISSVTLFFEKTSTYEPERI